MPRVFSAIVITIVCVAIVIGASIAWGGADKRGDFGGAIEPAVPAPEVSRPTDFAEVGKLSFGGIGQKPGVPYLAFGKASTTVELVLDAESTCAASNGATQCMAMSVTFDIPFNGKNALIEGLKQPDGSVLVRKLRAFQENEPMPTPRTGIAYIVWPQARQLIVGCQVRMVTQAHDLGVGLEMKDGRSLQTIEPVIDEVFRTIQETGSRCGNIPVATE